jgi:hypothetical protein
MLLRASWGSMRSAVFLAAFVAIYQGAVESVFYLLSTDGELRLTRKLVTRLLLRGAERTSCTGRAAARPCLAARRGRLQADILAWRLALGNVGAY